MKAVYYYDCKKYEHNIMGMSENESACVVNYGDIVCTVSQ